MNTRTPITGKQFNEMYRDKKFYKITFFDEVHNGITYKTGLNEDPLQFNCEKDCSAGGIYFTDDYYLPIWLNFYYYNGYWLRNVKVPDDAKVFAEHGKYKASAVILDERVKIEKTVTGTQ